MDIDNPALRELAARLRVLARARTRAPDSNRELSERTLLTDPVLEEAMAGKSLPPWLVVSSFVSALGDDPDNYRALWEKARRVEAAEPVWQSSEPTPQSDALSSRIILLQKRYRLSFFLCGALLLGFAFQLQYLDTPGPSRFVLGALGSILLAAPLLSTRWLARTQADEHTKFSAPDAPLLITVERVLSGLVEVELPTELLPRKSPLVPLVSGLVGVGSGVGALLWLNLGSVSAFAFGFVTVVFGLTGVLVAIRMYLDRQTVLNAVQELVDTCRVLRVSSPHARNSILSNALKEQLFALRRSQDNHLATQVLEVLEVPVIEQRSLNRGQ